MSGKPLRPEERQEPVLIERSARSPDGPITQRLRPSDQTIASPYRLIEDADAPNWQAEAAGVAADPDTLTLGADTQSDDQDALDRKREAAVKAAQTKAAEAHRPASPEEHARKSATAMSYRERRRRERSERGLFTQTASYIAHWIGGGFALASLAVTALGLGVLMLIPGDLPDHQALSHYQPALRSVVLGGDGKKVAEFAPTNRIYVRLEKIPQRVVQTFLAAEDHRFYQHDGFDLRAVGRAALVNLGLYGDTTGLQGGSTITQQVVKNLLLTSERSIERKVKELVLAWRIERSLSKDQILEIYLNEIFMGRTAYGVAAAARAYFGKTLDKLTIAETAFLAGLPQAPSRYNPEIRPKVATARRDHVLNRMYATGLITAEEHKLALATPIKVAPDRIETPKSAAWFVEEVRRTLRDRVGGKGMALGGFTVKTTLDKRQQKLARQALRKGLIAYDRRHGWRGAVTSLAGKEDWRSRWQVYLSAIDPPKGHGDWPLAVVMSVGKREALIAFADGKTGVIPMAELAWARKQVTVKRKGQPLLKTAAGGRPTVPGQVLKEGDVILVEPVTKNLRGKPYPANTFTLRQVPEVNGALVALDPRTGKVLALSGGFSFWKSQFNAATQAWRQPGSSFKPFVYLAALEAGLSPATTVPDKPLTLRISRRKVWKPKNYDGRYRGLMTIRSALASSRNLVSVRLAQHAGLATVARMAGRFGLTDRRITPVPSMALGSQETTLLRIVAGYGMLVNGGLRVRPTVIDRVTDREGRIVYRHRIDHCPRCGDFRPKALRRAAVQKASGDKVRPIADPRSLFQLISLMRGVVLRGTGGALKSAGVPVAGKTGTTNDHMDAWFVGFTPDLVVGVWVGFDRARTLGRREQGGFTAAPIARDFLKAVYKGRKVGEFVPPKGVRKVSVRIEAGEDEDGFPVYKSVTDWFKIDPSTGQPLSADVFIAGADDSEGHSKQFHGADGEGADRDGAADVDVYRGSNGNRRRVQRRNSATQKRQKRVRDTYGTFGR